MTSLRKQTFDGVKWTYLSQFLDFFARFVTSIVLIRYLATEEYGLYALILNLSGITIYFVSMGIQHSISRYIPEFLECHYFSHIRQLVNILFLIRIGAVCVILGVLAFYWKEIAQFFNLPVVLDYYLVTIFIFIFLQRTTEIIGPYLHSAILDYRTITIQNFLRSLLFALVVFVTSQRELGFSGLLAALLITEIFSLIFYGRSAYSHLDRISKMRNDGQIPPPLEWRRIGKYSLYNAFYTLGGVIVGVGLDNFIVARYLGVHKVALYTFAINLISVVHSLNPVIVLKPVINNLFVRRYTQSVDKASLASGFQFTTKIGLFFGFPSVISLCILAPYVISFIYRSDYLDSLPVLYIFAPMFITRYISVGLNNVINTLEKAHHLLLLNILSLFNLLVAILLAPVFGIVGVAAATCATEVLWTLYLWFVIYYRAGVHTRLLDKYFFRILANTLILAAFLLFAQFLVINVFILFIIIILGVICYTACSYINQPFTHEERVFINGFLGRKVWFF